MLRLRTFGGLTLERDGVRVDEMVAQRKLLALLAVLARSGGTVGRERLMALLWPDSDMERARGALKQMLHTLRRQLDQDVVTGTSEIQLNRELVSSDVGDFTHLIADGELEPAVELYRGPFLDGVHVERAPDFSRWQDVERAELQRTFINAVEKLAQKAEAEGRHQDAAAWCLRCLAVDPLRGPSVLAVMRALERMGDRAGALRHAQMHEDLLREELGALPDPDVAALGARIRSSLTPGPHGNPPVVTHQSPSVTVAHPATVASKPNTRVGRWFLTVGVLIAVLVAAIIPGMRDRLRPEVPANSKRVVVSMFANQTGDSTLNSLELLAADWMTRGVASTPGIEMLYPGVLYVQGRKPTGRATSALELARNNGAQLAIAGTFYRSRDSLYFTASIIDVPTGRVVRALGPFPTAVSTPLDGVEALRQGASVALGSMFDVRTSSFVSPTASLPRLDAYREFLIGEELHWRGDMKSAVPHFVRAGQLDSSFLLVAGRLAITAARAGRCDIVDSLAAAAGKRVSMLSDVESAWVSGSVAVCNGDWEEVVRLQRRVLAANPKSPLVKWALAGAMRRANHPAEAIQLYNAIDPERDLGWLVGPQRYFYWRELAGAQHAIDNFEGEWKTGDRFGQSGSGGVMPYYYKARSFVGRRNAAAAIVMVDSIERLPTDPPGTELQNRLRPIRAATTGWTMYGIAEELLAHGYPAEARAMAERTVRWVNGRSQMEKEQPEYRIMLARANMMIGNYKAAQTLFAELVKEDSINVEYRAGLGRAAALNADTATASRVSASLVTAPRQRSAGEPVLARAQIVAALGDRNGALALLRSLPFGLHPTDFLLLHSDAAFASLHQDRRFKELIRPKR